MQLLHAAVEASGLASDVKAAGNAVACLLPLTELSATIRVLDLDGEARELILEGVLPAGDGRLVLSPEKGVTGSVAALSEIEVDDAAVDDAWVIRGDGPALLVALLPVLAPLAPVAPNIEVGAELLSVRFRRPVALVELGARVQQALALWERIASFRLAAT